MTKSCLKLRCPSCKGRTHLSVEAFGRLRRQPTTAIEHVCEHCGHRFPATLLSGALPAVEKSPIPLPVVEHKPAFEPKAAEVPPAPVAAPFIPRATPAAVIDPPFGPLGVRQVDSPVRARNEAPAMAPPPFAAGAAADAPKTGKQSFNDWWKSQSPKRQWTFLACIAMIIGAGVFSLPTGEASAAPEAKITEKRDATQKKEGPKTNADAAKPASDSAAESKPVAELKPATPSSDDAYGLLCQETAALGGRVETPLAAAIAVDGKGFIARGAKVFADLLNAGGSTAKWVVATSTKRYKVTGVRFHPDFPADKLKALAAKGAQSEMLELLKSAEHADIVLLETTEAPAASLKLARDPASISGKPLEIASPADVKAAKGGASIAVKFARQALTADMLKEDGAGLAAPLAAGCDAAVVTKDGLLAAFVPRKNATGANVVHPIVAAETLAELLGAK
jgi:hypothetical protein